MQLTRKWMYLAVAPVIAAAVPGSAWLLSSRDTTSAAAKDKPKLRLEVDLSDKRLKMFDSDTLVWQYPISDGTASHPTPPGNYSIRRMVWNPRWTPPPNSAWAKKYTPKEPGHPANPMKVVKIFFREPDYYIHGTAETGKLGEAASHGCLRMDPEHIAEVAKYVMEHGGQPREENWFWRVLHFRSEEKPIYLKKPIPLIVRR
jgi:lipoprotein-anchoring transpeptidase ErfK/SrfK